MDGLGKVWVKPHYYEPTDTIDTLDLNFFSNVVEGLVESLAKVCNELSNHH